MLLTMNAKTPNPDNMKQEKVKLSKAQINKAAVLIVAINAINIDKQMFVDEIISQDDEDKIMDKIQDVALMLVQNLDISGLNSVTDIVRYITNN